MSGLNDDELIDALRIRRGAERGYADFDTWPDKAERELGIGRDFAQAAARDLGLTVSGLLNSQPGSDPPDLIAEGAIGVELTELVDQSMVERARADRRHGILAGHYRDWTAEQLTERLSGLIARKDRATPNAELSLVGYWLVVHTDEPGLSPELVRSHLSDWQAAPCALLTRCFLLLSYFPSHGGRPVFELPLAATA
jgi:hypothetical protein